MTSSTTDAGSPDHLLAIDLDALGIPDTDGWQRLGDRISAMRMGTVLVFIGGSGHLGLPEPDYVIEGGGASIIRMPSMEIVDGWTTEGSEGVSEAIAHLAGELLIPWSEVYCVLGAARPRRTDLERLVVIGGAEAPGTGIWLETPGADAVIEALETLQLFGRSVHSPTDVTEAGFHAAIDTVRRNVTEHGFTAASLADNPLGVYDANYAAVWARDGVITGLWTLCLDDDELVDTFRRTIRVLAKHQSPTGQIPANVRLGSEQPDYSGIGGIASIDSVLWFVVGAVRLAFHTGDRDFAVEIAEPVARAMGWLAAHDANNDALIEIPESSDWMDIFPRSYNVLYDEVLWWQACLDTAVLFEAVDRDGAGWRAQADRVREQILHQFWPTGEQLMEIAGTQTGRFSPGEAYYLLSQITPFDYGWRCDVYANLLAALGGLLDERKLDRLFTFLWGVGVNSPYPVACLYPPIASGAEDWKDYFLVNFLNLPHHYHNGGLWPFIGGLWVRYLAAAGRVELAHRELASLAEACRQGINDEWEFNEWLHGTTGRPMGKAHQAWSAASYIHAYLTLHGDAGAGVFPALDPAALP
jgi:glycogen debranching enzyme